MSLQRMTVGSSALLKETVTEDGAALNISAATAKQIVVTKPDQTTLTPATSFTTDGSNGLIQAQLTESDVDSHGLWQYHATCTLGGRVYITSPVQFYVRRKPETIAT